MNFSFIEHHHTGMLLINDVCANIAVKYFIFWVQWRLIHLPLG